MANKPKYFDIEDSITGKTYRVETDAEDATYDEAASYLESLPEDQWTQYEYTPSVPSQQTTQQASPVTTPAEPVVVSTPQAAPVEDKRPRAPNIMTTPDKVDFAANNMFDEAIKTLNPNKPLPSDQEATVLQMVANPDVPIEQINQYLASIGRQPINTEETLKNRELIKTNPNLAIVPVYNNPNIDKIEKELVPQEFQTVEGLMATGPKGDSYLDQFRRSVADAAQYMSSGTVARLVSDWTDLGGQMIDERYPDLSPEEREELQEAYVAYVQKRVRDDNVVGMSKDSFIPWIAGQVVVPDISDLVLFKASKFASAGARTLQAGGRVGTTSAISDTAFQLGDVAAGVESEFDPTQPLVSFATGAALGSGLQGLGEIGSAVGKRMSGSGGSPASGGAITVPTGDRRSKAYREGMATAVQQANDHVAKVTEGWTNSPKVQVYNNFTKLKGVNNKAQGVFMEDGSIALNLEQISKLAAKNKLTVEEVTNSVIFHESLGHYALNQEYGATLDDMLDTFYSNGTTSFQRLVDEWMDNNPKQYLDGDPRGIIDDPELYRRVRATEEVMAKWAEDEGVIPKKYIDTFINMVKDFLRRMDWGGYQPAYSPREVKSLLAVAQEQVTRKPGTDAAGPGSPRYMYIGSDQLVSNVVMRTGDEQRSQSLLDDLDVTRDMYHDEIIEAATPEEQLAVKQRYSTDGASRAVTGWFIGPDDKWRLEISDANATLVDMPEPGSSAELGDVLAHDELFDLYPELSEIIIEIGDDSFKDFGEFTKNKIKLNKKYFQDWVSGDPQRQRELLSTIIHEVQHAVQDREYFGMGGNSGSAYKYLPNDIFYRGIRNLSDNIRKYDLKKLTVLRDTAEVVRNSQEYKDYVEATSYTQDAWDFLVKSKEVSGDSSPTTVRAREIWSKRSDAAYEAKERLNATLGLPRFVTDDQVPKQDITDYFDLMRTVENPENTLKKITELSEDIAVLETALKTRNKDTRKKAEKIVRDDPLASIEAYQALMGEVEARDTQLRLDMTPAERRATKPYSLEGKYAPEDFAVTRYEGLPTEEAAKSRRPPTEEETTSAGFRRPVIDDRMIAEDRRLRRENALRNERELEEKYGNRYMMVDTDGEGGNKPFIDPRRPIPVRGGGNNPDIAPVTDDDAFELQSAQDILLELTEGYTPGARSWEDTKRDRSLTKGLTAGEIKNLKGVGDISLRLYQYEALQQKLSDRVTDLYYKMQTGGATPQIKAQYLETMYKFKELSAHIFDDQAEVGRALNFMKNLSLTRRKVNELNDVLREYNGSGVSAFASDDFFQEFAERVQYMINSGNPAGAANIVKQIDKPYWWQYILSARHAMMLSGLGTHAKNAYDGLMMIAREMEETTMALPLFYGRKALKAMGKDVQDGVSPQEVTARAYGLMRALLDSGTYKDTAKAFWEGHQSRSYSAKIEMQDARIPVLSKVNDALYASDTFFRAFHMNANLYTLGVRKAREDGFTGMRALEEGTANAMNPTKEMLEKARNLADVTLLVDSPSALGNMVEPSKAIRPGMKGGEQAGRFAANMLFPFLRVTDRLLFQAIRRSPLSFLDKNTRAEWAAGGAERDIAIARTVYGSALMAYYWQQAGIGADQEGDVEGAGPPDYKKAQSLEATGYRPNSEVQGNKMVDITALNLSMNPLGTDNNIAAQIASIREAWERGKKGETEAEELGNQFTEVGRALLGVLASQSYAENLSTFIDPLIERDPARKETAEAAFFGGLGSQFVPAAGRQLVQQVLDPERKVTRGDGSGADRIYGRIASGIPGLSETLPDRVDALGDTMPQGRTTLGIGNYTEIKQDDVSKEIRNIERNTKKPLMTTAPSSFQLEGRTVRLTAEQQQKWNSVQGRLTREVMSIVVADPGWKKFDLATKVEFVKELRSEAYEAAKMEVLPDIDFEVQLKEEEL